jgi:hypothetical protein
MLVLALAISNFAGLDLGFVKTYAQEPVTMQGSGSEGDPYQITNYTQLKEFAGIVNDGQTDVCAKLMNDIVCTDKLWVPIGNANNKYNGHFNDNDEEIKKIIGLNNTGFNDVDDKKYQGLFGYIDSNGIVKNIGIEGGEIKGKDFIGGVAGENEGTITNCYNTGSISGSGASAWVGGVAGINEGTITNCYNTGLISAGGAYAYVGGVAGYNNYGTITNCYNTGSFSGSGAYAYVGGVAGRNLDGTITNCYNTGSISGNGDYAYVGGVAGRNEGTITNCYNTGSISGNGDYAYVGGVAGYNSGPITNCYYDSNRSNVSNAIGNQDDDGRVEGLTTEEMTGSNVDQNMKFAFGPDEVNPWLYQENDNNNYFYPHLNGVNFTKKTGISETHVVDKSIVPVKDWPARILSGSENGGSQNNPYEISDYNMLKQFSDIVNGYNGYNKKTDACAIITNDIVCTDKLWIPIGDGNNNKKYTGHFDGNNKKIIGLSNENVEQIYDKKDQGLFGYISHGEVKDLGLVGCKIVGEYSVGGIAGSSNGKIINSYNTGTVTGIEFVGGVAGENEFGGRIINSYNTGTITGIDEVGGVVGLFGIGEITNSYNTGYVNGQKYIGGLVGRIFTNESNIINCYNIGIVTRKMHSVGGVTGNNEEGIITYCYYNKDIIGDLKGMDETDTETVFGLTTAEMTGTSDDEAIKIQFVYDDSNENPWIVKEDEVTDNGFKWYYPHLKGFDVDNEGNVISNPAKITNWPAYVEGTVTYMEPESYVYNGSALYPELMLKVGDDSYPENANVKYYVLNINGNWKDISDEPDEPGTYKISIKLSDTETTEKVYSIIDSNSKYYKKDAEGNWQLLSGCEECKDAGNYCVEVGGHSAIRKEFTISRADATVTADNKEKSYGTADENLTVTISGLKGTDTVDMIEYTISRITGENVGDYTITPEGDVVQGNYNVTYVSGIYKIVTSTVDTFIIELSKDDYVYDGTEKKPTITVKTETVVIPTTEYEVTYSDNINAGTATVTVTDNANGNYNVSGTTMTFTINRAEARVKADDITITYGDAIPNLTANISGIVAADENKQNLITYTVSRTEGTDVGAYIITPGGDAVQGNYNVTYVPGTLTIIKQLAGITKNPDAVKGLEYDGNNQELVTSGTPEDGITIYYALGADNITAPAPDADNTWGTAIPSAKDAGTYYVWFKAVADDNHSTDDEAACIPVSISRASVTVTADDKTKSYGAVDAALTATVSGLKGTDTADMIKYILSRTEGENAGTYAITPAGEAEQGNYTVTYVPGIYTITTSTENIYDITLSQDTYTYDGTEKVPTVTVSTGTTIIPAAEYEVTITNNINAGTATVTVTDVAGGNYNVSGTAAFTIEKADPAYNVPTGLTALTGKTLSDVSLPDGWTWIDKDASVGAAGANKFKAVYTPEDTANYNTIEDIDVVVTVSEPAPDPTPAIIPDPAPVVKPQPSPEPEVKEPELPYTTNETVTNKDGSATKIETTYNKDGSKTETSVREYTNGNKTTKLTLTNDKGVNLIKASEAIKTDKKGTTTISTNIQAVNGYNYQSEVKTTKSGKEVSEVKITNADKSSSYEKTVTYSDGNITKNSVKVKADGTADITFCKYTADTSVADDKNDTSKTNSGSVSGSDKSGSEKSTSEVFASDILAGMTPSSGVTGSAVFGTFGSKVDDTTISDMVAKVSVSITAPDTSLPADAETVEELRYTTTSDKKAKLVKCITASEKVTIPSKISINGTSYTVTTIGKNAFKKASSVKCVVLGKTITKFGNKAFNGISKDAVFVMKVKSDTRKKIARLIKKSGYKNTIQVLYSANK